MARRGVMTALQAALAGIGGAAGGYVQQQELERKRKSEEEARKRQEMLDIVGLQERGFMSPEQLAQQQMQGKRTTGTVVQNALLSALSPRAGVLPPPAAQDVGTASQALATAGLTPERIVTAGGQEMFRLETPQQEALRLERLKEERTRMGRFEEDRAAIDRAVRIAQEQGKLQQQFGEEKFKVDNRRDYDTFIALGGKGKYNPSVIYSDMIKRREAEFGLAGQRSLITARTQAAGAGAGGVAGGSRAERIATLPTVANAAEKLAKMDAKSVSALDGFGVSAASQVPQILTQTRGGFAGMLALPTAALYGKAAGSKEREYAEMTQAISDAVASMVSVGVLTDKDIDRFKQQVQFYPGDESKDKIRKFNSLRSWASWLQSGGEGKYPGETDDEYFQRTSMLRAAPGTTGTQAAQSQGMGGTTAQMDAETERYRRAWDTVAAQYGEEYAKSKYGERP